MTMNAVDPMLSRRLVGHEKAWTAIAFAAKGNKLGGSWMIAGPKGVGKNTMAAIIAKKLLSNDRVWESSAVQESNIVKQIEAFYDPNCQVIRCDFTDEEKRKIKTAAIDDETLDFNNLKRKTSILVDDVRKVIDSLALIPVDGRPRVVIIDSADDLNANAANALLKTLEEPPNNTTIILLAHNLYAVLETVRSRCKIIKLKPLCEENIVNYLKTMVKTPSEVQALLSISGGSIGMVNQILNNNGLEIYQTVNHLLSRGKITETIEFIKKISVTQQKFQIAEHIMDYSLNQLGKNDYEKLKLWEKQIVTANNESVFNLDKAKIMAVNILRAGQ